MDYSFSKSVILSKQIEIDELFSKGKHIKNRTFTILYRLIPKIDAPFQVLISIPKRRIKKAVDRNYLKRCVREILRKNKELLKAQENSDQKTLQIAIIYNSNIRLEHAKIEKNLIDLLHKTPFSK